MNLEQPENTPANSETKCKVWEAPVVEVIEYEQTQLGALAQTSDGLVFAASN